MRLLRVAVLTAASLILAEPSRAATVAIVRPPNPAPALLETLSRIHGELLSVGLEVEIADGPTAAGPRTPRAWLQTMATARGVDAVIDIIGGPAPMAVEVWFFDKASGESDVARVSLEANTETSSERLAIRAIEVLRSRFVELDLAAGEQRRTAAAKPPMLALLPREVSRPARQPERLGLAAGAAVLTSLDGVGTALMPTVRLDLALHPSFVLQAAVAGLGNRPTVGTENGNARVAQYFALLGACYRFRPDHGLRPFLALSAGALRTSVEGQADLPRQSHTVDQWSLLVEGSAGTNVRLGGRYYLTVAAHAQVAGPYVAIHVLDRVVATSGRPNLLLTLTIGAWL